MDQSVKIALASGVLLGGILLALLFRDESPGAKSSAAKTGNRMLLRKHPLPGDGQSDGQQQDGRPKSPAAGRAGLPAGAQTPTILRPMDSASPPPVLVEDYPGRGLPGTSRWGTSMGMNLPKASRSKETERRHKVVDGDSLKSLAKQYLDSADRYLEIFEANRDVLPSPQILPIGAELKIPPRGDRRLAPSAHPPSGRPLVPIPR